MSEMLKNKKVVYGIIAVIILIGLIMVCVFKFNFDLMYKEHTSITVFLGKEYNLKDVEKIAKDVFEGQEVVCQEVEIYKDTPVINVTSASEEELNVLKEKLIEKYDVGSVENLLETKTISNIRGRDIVKPYIGPILIATAVTLLYVAIRYQKLGVLNIVFDFLIKLCLTETTFLSLVAILRLPIGIYTMPAVILIYIVATILCIYNYQVKLDRKEIEEKKKSSK